MIAPSPYWGRLVHLQKYGRHDEARHLLAMLNRISAAFGSGAYDMPPVPLTGSALHRINTNSCHEIEEKT